MLRPKALDHVALKVTDMDKTLRFYQALGLELLRTSGPNAEGLRPCLMSFMRWHQRQPGPITRTFNISRVAGPIAGTGAVASNRPWEPGLLACALAAVAAAKGQPAVAEAILELTPDVARDFLEWVSER